MKQCCLNCSFCTRCVNNSLNFLTNDERKQALADNFDFIGKEQRIQKEWQKQYKQIYEDLRKGKYNKQLGGGPRVLDILTDANNPDDFTQMKFPDPIIEIFQLPPYPDAPYNDYLVCWHELWNFKNKKNEYSSLKEKNKCLFFYPYDKKGNKSFEGCEKERVALLNRRHFTITNWLVILGIVVSIVIYILQSLNIGSTTHSQIEKNQISTKENTAIKEK